MSQGNLIPSNRTIDDNFGDLVTGLQPIYTPDGYWSFDSTCSSCVFRPDPKLAFNGSWHDSSQFVNTAPVSVTLSFSGTAIYVFCIVPPIIQGTISRYRLNYTLETIAATSKTSTMTGNFSLDPRSTTDYQYNVPVVSISGLDNTAHTLRVSTNDASVFLFDYAVYTTLEAASTSKSHHKNKGAVAAGTVVGLLLVILIAIGFYLVVRQRRKRATRARTFSIDVDGLVVPQTSERPHVQGRLISLVPQRFLDVNGRMSRSGSGPETPPPVYAPTNIRSHERAELGVKPRLGNMPPKGGNAKKESGRAKKAENEAKKKDAAEAEKERKEAAAWADGTKGKGAKEDKEAKRQADLARKAENARLLAEEEKSGPAKVKAAPKAGAAKKAQQPKPAGPGAIAAGGGLGDAAPIDKGETREDEELVESFAATGIDNALDLLEVVNAKTDKASVGQQAAGIERHPERRFKAAFEAYQDRELPNIREEHPGLRLQQYKARVDLLFKAFQKSPENPFNQTTVAYDATKEEKVDALKQKKAQVEQRLREKSA
ncbi:hypothetical protein MIND_00997400 [Mycena indigotica]|uniref:Uncharacterized protein n=1 Tax=Mycena indigotica TaxID=2126181 RepID=A0A8H6S943_9AGAR|nr:uncharacterized protein MIND_00997400 [Mycena indigotica]KAF7294608.1 hypothetical protein MIND_00997400 [Mycena indigotica]